MADLRKVMKSLKPPSPDLMVAWVRDDQLTITEKRIDGYEFYELTPEEKKDVKKRESKIGKFQLSPTGRLVLGDLVAMLVPKKVYQKMLDDAATRGLDKIYNLGEGGHLIEATDGHVKALAFNYHMTKKSLGNPHNFRDKLPEKYKNLGSHHPVVA